MLTSVFSFIFVLGLLIFVHELGHFVTAKMVGIKVETFSLGFPPRMFGKKIGETDYCISWLPLGGYVKMAGMVDESMDTEITGEPWEFQSKSTWQKTVVISAGSFMNIVTAILIFAGLGFFTGIPGEPQGAIVSEVLPGSPAESIGLQPGDLIVSIDEQPITTMQELIAIVSAKAGVELAIQWKTKFVDFGLSTVDSLDYPLKESRMWEDELQSSVVVPELEPKNKVGMIGARVGTQIERQSVGLFQSLEYGTVYAFTTLQLIVSSLKQIITGEQPFREAIGGPIIIAKMASESAKMGWASLLAFTAFISLNLGFFNLLPFPVLDGGHLVFLGIEGIRRKPISVKTKLAVQKVGMAFLLALMVFVIYNDIRRLSTIQDLF